MDDPRTNRAVQQNTLDAAVTRAQSAGRTHPFPAGTEDIFASDQEEARAVWDAYIGCLGFDDWGAASLAQLVKVVRLELDIRKGHERLRIVEAQGSDRFVEDSHAALYYKNIKTAELQQLKLLRALGLTTSPSFVGPAVTRGRREKEAAVFATDNVRRPTLLALK